MKKIDLIKWLLIILFAASIIPLIVMGFYARPLWDDFNNSAYVHKFIEEGNPLFLLVPFVMIFTNYLYWQGTYAAEFLFSIQPGVWPIPAYWLTAVLLIGALSFSYLFFWATISEEIFHQKKAYGISLGLALLILQFQYVPFIHQAFFWFNGASYYSFFFALMLIELALVIRVAFSENEFGKKKINLIAVLAFIVSGGNYSTALCNCVILIMITILELIQKNEEKAKKIKKVAIVAVIGLVISMVAPGNAARAATIQSSMSATSAILQSIKYGLKCVKMWTGLQQIGLLLVVIPIIYFMIKDSNVRFRYPIIAIMIIFGLYAAQMTPPIYAMGFAGDDRQVNMYYYSYYMLLAGCTVYTGGWLVNKIPTLLEKLMKYNIVIMILGAVLIITGIIYGGASNLNAYKAGEDIISGRAAQYDAEYEAIIDSIKTQDDICYVNDIGQWTNSLDKFYITEDPDYWVNKSLAEYYGKKQVILKVSEDD